MEKFTIEQKAKLYDEVVERAKEIINNQNASSVWKGWLCNCFPELTESKDERIRRVIRGWIYTRPASFFDNGISKEEMLAWLEKQGEKNTAKPKYHEGDWIVHNVAKFVFQIVGIDTYGYNVVNREGYAKAISLRNEENYHIWTIEDAKDGDVLVYKGDVKHSDGIKYERICLFNNLNNAFFTLTKTSNSVEEFDIDVYIEYSDNTVPATKEQRDLLFHKMHEAGYEWDAEKKELKKIKKTDYEPDALIEESYQQQADDLIDMVTEKPIWSEEDEHRTKDTIYFLDTAKKHYASTVELDACIDCLKKLKERVQPQPKQEWKEDDEKLINRIEGWLDTLCDYLKDSSPDCIEDMKDIVEQFKSLKQRCTWRPSEEQIKAIQTAIGIVGELTPTSMLLKELREQLKKLREK